MLSSNDVMWNQQPWPAGPTINEPLRCDVCVVGLGASGLTALQTLHAHGIHAIGIDAGMVGAGAAGSNGGFILAGIAAFHHDAVAELGNARATRLYQRTLAEIERLRAEEPTYEPRGSLRIAMDDAEYADCLQQYAVMRGDGLPVERYDGPEGRGILVPTDGVFQPLDRVRRIATGVCTQTAIWYSSATASSRSTANSNGFCQH
jgi:glycine/D-amino acid oxidase-like deaminating enzyme